MMSVFDKMFLLQGDLTEMDTDSIVNAANSDLQLGGGVAGAIRRKGGEVIQRECDAIGPVPVGGAAITSGGRLRARHVIHAASMQLGGSTDASSLRAATAHSLRIAAQQELKSIAFPAVGTGIAGFPLRRCAEIMLREAADHLKGPTSVREIHFVLFDAASLHVFQEVFREMKGAGAEEARLCRIVQQELARYEHPLFSLEAIPSGEAVEVCVQYHPPAEAVHAYAFQLKPREIENPQFPWSFQKQLYDSLHDYLIEMFTRNPQRED
jgi:O-acetyl-ADP-ribose deacetylase (regulator of RNase III)